MVVVVLGTCRDRQHRLSTKRGAQVESWAGPRTSLEIRSGGKSDSFLVANLEGDLRSVFIQYTHLGSILICAEKLRARYVFSSMAR